MGVLRDRVAAFQASDPKRSRHKERKRRRRDRSSTSSAEEAGVFRDARGTVNGPPASVARRYPGELLRAHVEKIKGYLVNHQGGAGAQSPDGLAPIVTAYLTSVLQPSLGKELTRRNERELRTLAEAIDAILGGNLAGACDMLVQRFKAVEASATSDGWQVGRHLELIPEARVSSISQEERARAAKREREDVKLAAQLSGTSRGHRE